METTITDIKKWQAYSGIAGTTAVEWLNQVIGFERSTELRKSEVMRDLCIGGWSHSYHFKGDFGIDNTCAAHRVLLREVKALADELDTRLHQLTAVENEMREMIKDEQEE